MSNSHHRQGLASEKTSSWQTLLTLDRKSDDFTHLARGLLSDQKTRKSEQFTEEEAVNLIDLIDQTILQHTDITKELKSTAFTVLRRLCGTFGRLPTSCLIDVDFKTEDLPFATRGYTDLWKRDLNGGKVAVKALRFGPDDDRSMITKRFCKEILLWKILNHPNILPFYGIMMNPRQFCMVSPWMENGNVLSYTRRNPEANRLRLLIDVASGLKYLHRASLVHGNIRGSNILISDSQPPQALLADFGLNTIIFDPFSFTKASINWTAPELLTPDNSTHEPSISSDTYALAMVIYEVLTGTPPLAGRGKTELACKVALEDERPRRPRDSEKLGFTDKVWEVLQKCWEKKPSARPSVDIVSSCLKQAADTWVVDVPAFLLSSKPKEEQARNTEDQAKDFANQLDETLDQIGISEDPGKTYLKYLQKLCGAYGVLPASFMLTDGFDKIEPRPFASGRFAHVYKATYNGQPVVAKALKTASVDDLEDVHKRFAKQVVGWKWLRHENILPFVGVASLPPPFSIVSVRVENGDIASFMRANPDQNPFTLLVDVTNGLQYLHEHDFVHGNLRGANILINSENRACLADFGLFAIIEETTSIESEATGITRGSMVRWTAPEILNPEMYSGRGERACKKPPSKSTDIYALGMTIFEVVSGQRPFEHTNLDVEVIQKVLSGARPEKPSVGFSDALWTLLTHTWVEVFETADLASSVRPDITEVLGLLQDEAEDWSRTRGPLDFPSPTEQTPSAADSTDSLGFADQLAGPAGADPVDVPPRGIPFDVGNLLKNIDDLIGPEPTGEHLDDRDASAWDEQTNPILSWLEQTQARPSPRLSISPHSSSSSRASLVIPREKKKSGVGRAWDKVKKSLMKKFGSRGQAPPKLSDKLVPERDDEVKWYSSFFSKPSKPTITRR